MIRWLRRHAIDLGPLRSSRAFALIFWGRLVSIAGIGVLGTAIPLQVYALTGSSVHVALVATVLGLAGFAGALSGGLLADRLDRRKIILAARGAAVAGFALLAVNAFAPEPMLAAFHLAAVVDGLAGGISATALSATVPRTVEPAQLPAASALMAISMDLGMVLTPALGGLLYAAAGPGWLYLWVIVASVASVALLWGLPELQPGGEVQADPQLRQAGLLPAIRHSCGQAWADTREGMAYVARDRVVGPIMLLGFIQLLCASPYVLIPEFAERQLGLGPEAAGLLYSAPAAGALLASLSSGWTGRVRPAGRVLLVVLCASSLGVLALGLTSSLPLALAAMALTGVGDVLAEIFRYAIIAGRTPDRLLGRVSAVWSAQGTVGDTLGGPLLSLLAKALGPGGAIVAGGALAAGLSAVVALGARELRGLRIEPETPEEILDEEVGPGIRAAEDR
ncbi:enterobactin transporter EntS [Glutamicibacter arilaitensis]|uniref:Multidrug efflux pump Tap n=1 Tax=Glutamicibacter arilaitensis (strain DSM 16368 / CIP 108037 / IAM 15318 / JCM 13566 / NCIMB 14258 / Re117) TaxID=861360 RepID=A0ABM9Q1C3_GLUAR|nr:enterobactin transporter EntS [Glutamicibacter arilaitensis]CBT77479.1 putative siderophore exporter [Glutamicibacter arilaitensis Re117]